MTFYSQTFFNPIFIPCFSEPMPFRVQVFQGPCPGSEFNIRVQVAEVAIYNTLIFAPVTKKMF